MQPQNEDSLPGSEAQLLAKSLDQPIIPLDPHLYNQMTAMRILAAQIWADQHRVSLLTAVQVPLMHLPHLLLPVL